MPYNPYYPATYQPYYQTPYQQAQAQMMQQQAQAQPQGQQSQPPIQSSGFVPVQSEQEARAYPVAPGNSITFKDERAPYCYVKTMGFNQLDRPVFERYRLVKEEMPSEVTESPTTSGGAEVGKHTEYASKRDLEAIRGDVEAIKAKLAEKSAEVTGDAE